MMPGPITRLRDRLWWHARRPGIRAWGRMIWTEA